ncbi:MAG: T9SS type A sorting domain-containing protein, partial [Salibacter sp.]|uniref:T9SS type A sorting domain-containing protein n=1 Tax=Salibacter sp. TaxID=2010995 RepID=UPI0028708815
FEAAFEDASSNTSELIIGVMSDPNDPSTFVELQRVTSNTDDVFNSYTVDLDNAASIGSAQYIAIASGADDSNFDEIAFDDFVYEEIPTCFQPVMASASSISTSELEVNWTPSTQSAATDFVIEYGSVGFTPGMGDSLITQNPNADTITGLMSGTSYDVYVTAVCGAGDTSFVEGPSTATTYFNAPYFEDFEGLSSGIEGGTFGNGWVDVSSTDFDWHSNTGTTTSSSTGPNGDHTSGNGVYLYSEASNGSAGDTAILESPFVNISSLTNPYMSFWYHRHGADYLTGYIDIWDGSSWTTIDSIVGETQTAESDPYLKKELDLSSYSGDVKFRFWHIKDDFEADWSIDDVEVFNKPNDDIGVIGFVGDTALCGDSNTAITVIVENFGLADQSGFDITVDWTGSASGTATTTYNNTLVAGTTDTVIVDSVNTVLGGTFNLEGYTMLSGDAVVSNDTATSPTVTFDPLPASPSLPSMVSTCNGTDTTLVVNSTSTERVTWYDAGMNFVKYGDSASFTVTQNDTAYATIQPYVGDNVGPANYSALGSGGPYSFFTSGLEFDVNQEVTIDSVTVFVTGAGDVHVNIEDNSGNPVGSTVVSVNPTTSDEEITIPVGITVPAGTGYEMNATGSTVSDLYRNSGGASFPYTSTNGYATITDGTLAGYYYYFYDWVLSDSDCESAPARVTFESNPIPTVSLGNDTAYCEGDAFNITLDAGNAGATYNWSDNSTNQTLVVDTAGTYWVEVTSAGGCVDTDTLEVTENALPMVSLGNDTAYCAGDAFSITLDAGNAGATYNWSDNSTNQTLAVDTAGTYWVEVTNANGCVSTDTLEVTENALPMVDLGNDTAYCAGDAFSITLDAGNAGATYNWSDNSTGQTLTVNTAGTYWVEVTNAGGCVSTDTLEVTESSVPTVSLNDADICADETATLDAGAGFASYNWSTGETTQTITVSSDDSYDVTVTNAAGCEGEASAVVTVNPLPVVDLGNDTSMSPGYTITLDAGSDGDTYNWNTGASTQTVDVEYGDVPAEFSVEVTSAEGCVSTDTIYIDANTGVRDLVKGSIKLYPNPTRGNAKLDMTLTEGGEMMIEVYSISGQLLDQVQYGASAGQQIVPVDMSNYENGMYIINVKLNDESISQFNVTKM